MASLIESMKTPYLQLEFTAEDDMARSSVSASNGTERPNGKALDSSAAADSVRPNSRQNRVTDTRPRALLVSTGAFFIALMLLMFITSFACRSFVFGILRILEEEVDLSGSETVTIVLSYDIGYVFVLVIMGLQNRKLHRPRSVGFGGFLIGLGLLVVCIPYFIVRSDLTGRQWYRSTYELCDKIVRPPNVNESLVDDGGRTVSQDPPKTHWNSVAWIVLGLLLAGIGAVPQFPLGITYLEDRLRGFGTPFHVAILLCAYILGIWCGELANLLMWHNVANATVSTVALWWLGFFCSALVALVISLFIFMAKDPYKRLVKETKGASVRVANRTSNSRRYKRLETSEEDVQRQPPRNRPKVTPRWRRIFANVQLVCISLAGSLEAALLTGFLVFLPRYIGTVSELGWGPAKFYIGTTVLSSVCIGILTSAGLTLYKNLKSRGLWRMVVIGCAGALLVLWPLYIFRCQTATIVGESRQGELQSIRPNKGNIDDFLKIANATAQCNLDCQCVKRPYRPVCGSDGLTYLSPCLAGCQEEQLSKKVDWQGLKFTNFTDCACITTTSDNATSEVELGYTLSGPCIGVCSNGWPFLCLVFVAFFMTGLQFGPMILLSIRCVIRADRIAAVTFQVALWHLLGYVPGIIYFSSILNQSCAVWGRPNAQNYHECILYDSYRHNAYFVTVVLVLKGLSLVLLGGGYRYATRRGFDVNTEWEDYDHIEMEPIDNRTTSRTNSHSNNG